MSATSKLPDAPIDPGKAIADNPDLPLQFINDTLLALQEANAGKLTPYTFGSFTCDTTLRSKGQTTIPKAIRTKRGLKTGDHITFTLLPDGTAIMRAKNKSILDLAGMLHKEGRAPLPVEQLSF